MQAPVLDAATLETLVSAAVAAPSMHNTQPWRFRLDPHTDTLEVHAAPERALPLADPTGRAMHLSVGAAVLNLRVAVAHFGWEPVPRLLPRPSVPGLLATVRLAGPPQVARASEPDLYEAIWRRHSSRLPFTGDPVPETLLGELAEAAGAEEAQLSVPDRSESERLLSLTTEAEWRDADARRLEESRSWITDGSSPYGIPGHVLPSWDSAGRVPVRDFGGPRHTQHSGLVFEADPQLLLLSTWGDERADWLRAGQALERVLLTLTDRGLRASLLHQALEWDDLRWLLRDPCGGFGAPQMLIRIGYGPEGPATPRGPAAEQLSEERLPAGPARPSTASAGA